MVILQRNCAIRVSFKAGVFLFSILCNRHVSIFEWILHFQWSFPTTVTCNNGIRRCPEVRILCTYKEPTISYFHVLMEGTLRFKKIKCLTSNYFHPSISRRSSDTVLGNSRHYPPIHQSVYRDLEELFGPLPVSTYASVHY